MNTSVPAIYHFDRDTRVFIGAGEALESPVRKGTYLPIAFSTDKPPPAAPEGQVAVFDIEADDWALVPVQPPAAPALEPVSEPTLDERMAAMEAAVEDVINARAKALGYKSIDTAVSYADEPAVLRFQREGAALRAWRSRVWARCYEVRDQVVAGELDEPADLAALIELLPVFVLPQEDAT